MHENNMSKLFSCDAVGAGSIPAIKLFRFIVYVKIIKIYTEEQKYVFLSHRR